MIGEKKTPELTDSQTEQASGGESTKIEYKYHVNQIVINEEGWKLKIIELYGWNNFGKCPNYKTVILDKPDPHSQYGWRVGQIYFERENRIVRVES